MCSPAPVVERFGRDVALVFAIPREYNVPGPGGVFLGSVGDQRHSVKRTSHNCASAPGGQESPVNGVSYHPDYAHAWDCRPKTEAIGYELVKLTLQDPRVRYVLYKHHGWYPDGTFEDITDNDQWDLDHETFHVSFKPGTHDDTRPFFQGDDIVTEAQMRELLDAEQDTRKLILTTAQTNLEATWATRRMLRKAGVIPGKDEDDSDIILALEEITKKLADD